MPQIQIIVPSGLVVEGDVTLQCLKVRQVADEASGAYFISGRTGLVASANALGGLMAFRWMHPTLLFVLDLFRVRATFTTPPTAAQEWGLDAIILREMTAGITAGAGYGAERMPKKRGSYGYSGFHGQVGSSTSGGIFLAAAASMTLPAQADQSEFAGDVAWELAAGAAVPRSIVRLDKDYTQGQDSPPIFGRNEGIAVRNVVAVGAAGVYRAWFELAWHEADPSEL